MNVIELLNADHKVVSDLFEQVKKSEEATHPAILVEIKSELDTHMHIEETLLYPKLKADGDKALVDITLEAVEEHHQIKMFLNELEALSGNGEKFEPKLRVLMEDVEGHVNEEEKTMFPLVRDQFDADVLDELGAAMEAEKAGFQKTLSARAGK